MFCIYSVIIHKSILTMRRAVVLYLFCNNFEIHSIQVEGGCFVSILQ